MEFLNTTAGGDPGDATDVSAQWVTQCTFCGYTNNVARNSCTVCHRRLACRDDRYEKMALEDIKEQLGLQTKVITRGRQSATGEERTKSRKMLKRAQQKGYTTIAEYFAKNERFRIRKRSEGWNRDSIKHLDYMALMEGQTATVPKAVRMQYERTVEVAGSGAGGSNTIPMQPVRRERPEEWSSEAWSSWSSWSSGNQPGWSWERR